MLGVRALADPLPTPTLHSTYSNQRGWSLGDSVGVGEKGARANSCSLLQPILEALSL